MKDIEVDELLKTISIATDEGDFKSALDGLNNILKHADDLYGDTIELTEIKQKIAEINELLS